MVGVIPNLDIRGAPSGGGIFNGSEIPERLRPAVYPDVGPPLLPMRAPGNPVYPGGVVPCEGSVSLVPDRIDQSQIMETVIARIMIFVVNLTLRPYPIREKPRYP